ncbi:MAG: competence/damage-inducible protein A [Bernardetiaceae bacterium]|jgi:nicotinamide-nucleotide amidase|nr:competence/damage-inducible protein A [Bernardetiaceae bacterium]
MPTENIYAEILTIGDEILYGQITDTNSQWMSAELDKAGFRVARKVAIGDTKAAILQGVTQAEQSVAQVVLMTGGLGPTKDDITKTTLAEYFGSPMRLDEGVLANITRLFAQRGRTVSPTNQLQAQVPQLCQVLMNEVGTAPGMWFERGGKVFVSMPGVPHEMKWLMANHVIPRLRQYFATPVIAHKMIRTINIPESTLSDLIEPWELALPPHIRLAYLPKMGQVRLRLTGTGNDQATLEAEMQAQIAAVLPLIQKNVYGFDDDEIEKTVGRLLVQTGHTIATAESCTGGYVAHQLTQWPGSSRYFVGGIVAYSNEVKMSQLGVNAATLAAHGAVSEATALEMATHVRQQYGASLGIATTGVAGPDGGTPEKPVGTVWIALAHAQGAEARKLQLSSERALNISLTNNSLLNWVRLWLEQAGA